MTEANDHSTGDLFAVLDDADTPPKYDGLTEDALSPEKVAGGVNTPPPSHSVEINEMHDGRVPIAAWAERAYLDYAMSVVKGRALPNVEDGQKPVQRRILTIMKEMGLDDRSKPVKSARVVGDVMGRLHPHGDSSIYDAMVRMAQDFSLRYPLVDGQGNFGSRDGDGAAAMRYTEARLTPFADILLGEIDKGTVDYQPNYDGAFQEPTLLPARLPVLLLNGASGIAVGMATDIPSHNLREVADACALLIRRPDASFDEVMSILPGPDYPGGAQIISSMEDIHKVYSVGRGSVRVRARWVVEQLARGQWQVAVTELPPGVSTQKVLEEIEEYTNPKIKAGKKALTQEQGNMKALFLSVLDRVRDDSDKDHPVRMIFEPRSSRQTPDELMTVLLAHTSLECNNSVNLVTIGLDGKPQQKGVVQVLKEWVAFRYQTVTRRSQRRLFEVERRIHILDGRMIAFLNIDHVIKVIRESDEPKQQLIKAFGLSETQAEDILEIRLRQLARLEGIKIESELAQLRDEQAHLQTLLSDHSAMTDQIVKELDADRTKYGDDRRTLIEVAERITSGAVAPASDDPVTIIVSRAGWFRARTGHGADLSTLTFKAGDELLVTIETRTSQTLAVFDTNGRCYNVSASMVPTGRGDGVPLTSLVEIQAGGRLVHVISLDQAASYLVSSTGGYGYVCTAADLLTRQKAGKAFMSLDRDELMHLPTKIAGTTVSAVCSGGRLLLFPVSEVKHMPKGKGVKLMELEGKETLVAVHVGDGMACTITTASGKPVELAGHGLDKYRLHRARKGCQLPGKAKPTGFDGEAGRGQA
ncbi:DNA topoisomerase IV subunit A [Cupriavidus sp. TMH.W2]|uniref:DNA topoisomerase IV subunit A n=1 Tax=Cupriavidus sp. TMH.W2 TaxID=3434465 RepID=UPI003D785057